MKIAVSDLLFPGFKKFGIRPLNTEYGIEFFYEFGHDYYWDEETAVWGDREFSIHGPCVAVDLADEANLNYLPAFEATFKYAQKIKSQFVVVHTNECLPADIKAGQELVISRLAELLEMAQKYGVTLVIENVGLRSKGNVLFTLEEYYALFERFPQAMSLIDTGHAHVNGWDIPAVVEKLGSKLFAFHIHDNDGNGDDHLPVWQGTIDWDKLFPAIKAHAPKAILVMEYCCGFENTTELEAHLAELKAKYEI